MTVVCQISAGNFYVCPYIGGKAPESLEKFAPCELGVRAGRTDSPRRANWESARRELFGLSEAIVRRVGGEGKFGTGFAIVGYIY